MSPSMFLISFKIKQYVFLMELQKLHDFYMQYASVTKLLAKLWCNSKWKKSEEFQKGCDTEPY